VSPAELIAEKVTAFVTRRGSPKSFTDRRDLAILLLTFPDLKSEIGPVLDRLRANSADSATLAAWSELVAEEIRAEDEDAGY
jgi:hypothetical protein